MIKNKLAKFAANAEENGNVVCDIAQQPLRDDFDPISMLDEQHGSCTNGHSLSINAYEQVPTQRQPVPKDLTPNWVGFIAGPDDGSR